VKPSTVYITDRKKGRPRKNPISVKSVNVDAVGSLSSQSSDAYSCASVPLALITDLDVTGNERIKPHDNEY